mmetsp:Transcript_33844/g.108179  ORF Transcript_33844/g.108179 Transcript_33844/m.108179 type:complete len:226 (-) Transcript_33844:667-1344(-)
MSRSAPRASGSASTRCGCRGWRRGIRPWAGSTTSGQANAIPGAPASPRGSRSRSSASRRPPRGFEPGTPCRGTSSARGKKTTTTRCRGSTAASRRRSVTQRERGSTSPRADTASTSPPGQSLGSASRRWTRVSSQSQSTAKSSGRTVLRPPVPAPRRIRASSSAASTRPDATPSMRYPPHLLLFLSDMKKKKKKFSEESFLRSSRRGGGDVAATAPRRRSSGSIR